MKKTMMICATMAAIIGFVVLPALAADPVITLDRVDVNSYQEFYVNPFFQVPDPKDPQKKVMSDKPKGGGFTSTLSTAYIFSIKNPGKEPIMFDQMNFTVTFDGFEVNTVLVDEDMWIPGGKTNNLRAVAVNEAAVTMGALAVGSMNVKRLQEMKTTPAAIATKWWKEISDFSFPVGVEGVAVFKDEKGKEKRVPVKGTFPPK